MGITLSFSDEDPNNLFPGTTWEAASSYTLQKTLSYIGTATPSSQAYATLLTKNIPLKKGDTLCILTEVHTTQAGNTSEIMVNELKLYDGNDQLDSKSARTTLAAGGGCVNSLYYAAPSDQTVRVELRTYGYTSTSHTYNGQLVAYHYKKENAYRRTK